MSQTGRIDVRTAVARAVEYFREFEGLMPVRDIRLEETELDDGDNWLITLSAIDAPTTGTLAELAAKVGAKRIYKVFKVDGSSGEVKSMKVRVLEPIE